MRFESRVTVDRPIEEVWALLTDPFNIPRFGRSMLGLRKTSPGPTGVGAVWQGRMNFLGSERNIIGVVTEWDPPRAATWSGTAAGMGSGSIRQTLDVAADGTKVVRAIEVEPEGIFRLTWPILAISLRRVIRGDPERIKRFIESGRAGGLED